MTSLLSNIPQPRNLSDPWVQGDLGGNFSVTTFSTMAIPGFSKLVPEVEMDAWFPVILFSLQLSGFL